MLTIERARALFRYEQSSGKLFWRAPTNPRIAIGAEAGSEVRLRGHKTMYRSCMVDGKRYLVHRIIWFMEHGNWPSLELDHGDRDGLNNRVGNLRDITHSANQLNVGRVAEACGVYLGTKGTWIAEFKRNGRRTYVGSFASKEAAVLARRAALEKVQSL